MVFVLHPVFSWVRGWSLWRHFCDHFPVTVRKTSDLDPSRSYVLCVHPHGVLSFGTLGALVTDALGIEELLGLEIKVSTGYTLQ